MTVGIVGGNRYKKNLQYTYTKEFERPGTLFEDSLNVLRVTGLYAFPTPSRIGAWLKLIIPTNLDMSSGQLMLASSTSSDVKFAGELFSELGIKEDMKGTEILVFVNNDSIWEVA